MSEWTEKNENKQYQCIIHFSFYIRIILIFPYSKPRIKNDILLDNLHLKKLSAYPNFRWLAEFEIMADTMSGTPTYGLENSVF